MKCNFHFGAGFRAKNIGVADSLISEAFGVDVDTVNIVGLGKSEIAYEQGSREVFDCTLYIEGKLSIFISVGFGSFGFGDIRYIGFVRDRDDRCGNRLIFEPGSRVCSMKGLTVLFVGYQLILTENGKCENDDEKNKDNCFFSLNSLRLCLPNE